MHMKNLKNQVIAVKFEMAEISMILSYKLKTKRATHIKCPSVG